MGDQHKVHVPMNRASYRLLAALGSISSLGQQWTRQNSTGGIMIPKRLVVIRLYQSDGKLYREYRLEHKEPTGGFVPEEITSLLVMALASSPYVQKRCLIEMELDGKPFTIKKLDTLLMLEKIGEAFLKPDN